MTYDSNVRPPTRDENLSIIGWAESELVEGAPTSDPDPLYTSDATRVDQALSSVLEHRNDDYVEAKGDTVGTARTGR
jgi:hypothetical protein